MSATNRLGNNKGKSYGSTELIEQIVSHKNMIKAYEKVVGNQGSSGVDGLRTEDLKDYLQSKWLEIKGSLLRGDYEPQLVKKVRIPKPKGGDRILGIPTVIDRLIQQGLHQVLSPMYDPDFSDWSYGFRPKRSAHQALEQAKQHIKSGKRWVVDMDLSKFFDEVNHQRLLSKLSNRIKDRRVIHLIERYLKAGMLENGVEEKRIKGTPQGSPLSPLLSNIVLDELDKELEKRGHRFVRYADDFQIYVGSLKSAERVMNNLGNFIEKQLRLRINKEKSAIDRPWNRSLLGYSFTTNFSTKLRVPKESIKRFKKKVKAKLRQGRGRNEQQFIVKDLNPLLRGWMIYFSGSDIKGFTKELDSWIRRHLRKNKWRQQKRPWTRKEALMKRGLSEENAVQSTFNQRGAWWNAGSRHMNFAYPAKYFEQKGLVSLQKTHSRYHLLINSRNRRDT